MRNAFQKIAVISVVLVLWASNSQGAAPDDSDRPARPQRPLEEQPSGLRPPDIRWLLDSAQLTDAQKEKIKPMVEAFHEKQRQAHEELLRQLKEVVTPAQYQSIEAGLRPPPRLGRDVGPTTKPSAANSQPGSTQLKVTLTGGYDTDPQDHGRPVVLIAAALGIPAETFREAFSHVTPAGPGQEPQPDQVRKNKAALLNALSKYGIDNDKLDEVSNYYRYNRSKGEMWHNTPATVTATVQGGVVTGFTITNAGAGYTTPPIASIPGFDQKFEVKLVFGKDFKTNGSIKEITVAK